MSVLVVTTDGVPCAEVTRIHGYIAVDSGLVKHVDSESMIASLRQRAHSLGANAVVGTRIALAESGSDTATSKVSGTAFGTAVSIEPHGRYQSHLEDQPWVTSDPYGSDCVWEY